jgi:hypothetical protein
VGPFGDIELQNAAQVAKAIKMESHCDIDHWNWDNAWVRLGVVQYYGLIALV